MSELIMLTSKHAEILGSPMVTVERWVVLSILGDPLRHGHCILCNVRG